MTLLLFGRGGQVGWELRRRLAILGDLVALDIDAAASPAGVCGDFFSLPGLAEAVRSVAVPNAIINAAARTAVDKAEPERARTLNALAPGALAEKAQRLGAWLVHYSTDYVLDGGSSKPWRKDDAKAPLSAYGQTKLEGELPVARCPRHLTFRASWVYARRHGPPGTGGRLPLRGKRRNQLACLRYASCSRRCAPWPWDGRSRPGPNRLRRSRRPATCHRRAGPLNSRLSTAKLRAAFGLQLPHWQVQAARMFDEITPKKAT